MDPGFDDVSSPRDDIGVSLIKPVEVVFFRFVVVQAS